MADLDQDGCEFDEDGIYREKSFSGIYIDNDGIWCEEGERIGHFTGRDSGLGTNDRKSSSSTLNRLPIDVDQEFNDNDEQTQNAVGHRHRLQESRAEPSVNISEYEESDADSYDQEVIHSAEDLNFPELQDDYSNFGSENGGHDVITRSPRNFEFEYESVHSQDYDEVFSSGGDQETDKKPDDFAIYLTTSHGASALHAQLQQEPSLPIGDSLFTQEEDLDRDQVQSLREFEQLEQLALGNRKDHVNLIGEYLKGMENQDMMEDPSLQEFREERFIDFGNKLDGSLPTAVYSKSRGEVKENGNLCQSYPLDDSVIENELPPFGFSDSINFSSLDLTTNNEMLKSGPLELVEVEEQKSRIPMLRGRSPSMSRPGSSSSRPRSSRSSRPSSRTEMRSQNDRSSREQLQRKSPERRSLPATPQMSDSSRSNSQERGSRNSSIIRADRIDRSPDGALNRSPSASLTRLLPNTTADRTDKTNQHQYFKADDVIHQAAELLLHGSSAEYLDAQQINETKSGRSTPKQPQSLRSLPRSKTPTAKQNSIANMPKTITKTRQRPFSAEVVRPINTKPLLSNSRPSTPNSFKIRSHSTSGTGLKPIKALPVSESVDATRSRSSTDVEESKDTSITGSKSKNELKKKFLNEKNERQMKEQTLKQLQQEYHNLLQKYAEAENTIDSLRIGAKIPIAIELTTTSQGQQQGQADRRTSVVSAGLPPNKMGSVVSLASASGIAGIPGSQWGSRPPSSVSVTSGRNPKVITPFQGQIQGQPQGQPQGQEVSTFSGGASDVDNAKFTLLAEAKAVEEQTDAFETLMREQTLSLEEQEQVLVSVKSGYETLQQNFRDTKDEFMLKKRQRRGSSVSSESGFDDDKTVEGELYKLGMKLDELEHSVQENLKEKHAMRKPFQGPTPVKGDHSVGGGSVSSRAPSGLRRHWGSVTSSNVGSSSSINAASGQYHSRSIQGSSNEIEEKLDQVEQQYASLLEGYHRLKKMKQTPERDIHINDLLDTLRGMYHEAPSHLRLPPPPSSPSRGQSPEESSEEVATYRQDAAKLEYFFQRMEEVGGPDSDMNSDLMKGYSSSLVGSDRRSDRMSARYSDRLSNRHSNKMSDRPSGRSSDQLSARLSDKYSARERPSGRRSSDVNKARKLSLSDRQNQESSFASASESVESAILSRKSNLPSHPASRGSGPTRGRDTVDRDSGYIGSEMSRKTLDTPDKSRQHSYANSRKGSRAMISGERIPSGMKKAFLSSHRQRNNSKEYEKEPSDRPVLDGQHSRPKSTRSATERDHKAVMDYTDPRSGSTTPNSDEERQSYVSKAPTNWSVKSDQLQSLMDEVDKLKNVLSSRNASADSPSNGSGPNAGVPQGTMENSGYNAPGYYYYVAQGQPQVGKENQLVTQPLGNVSYSSVPQSGFYSAHPQEQTYVKVPATDSQYYLPQYEYDSYAHPAEGTAYTHSKRPPSDFYDNYSNRRPPTRPRPKSQYVDSHKTHRDSSRHLSPRRYKREDRGYNSDEDYRVDSLRGYYIPQQTVNDQNRSYNATYSYPNQPTANLSSSETIPAKPACPTCLGHGYQHQGNAIPVQTTTYTYPAPSQGPPQATRVPMNATPASSLPNNPQHQTLLVYSQTPQVPQATNVSFSQPLVQNQPLASSQPIHQQLPMQNAALLTSVPSSGAPSATLNTSYVPVQVLPANATVLQVTSEKGRNAGPSGVNSQGHSKKGEARVRYYIKEYKEEPKSKTSRKKRSTYTSQKYSPKQHESLSEDDSDSERSEPNLNESLENALETARELKKISRTLKSGLKKELFSVGDIFI